jgi:hypothetical protein
VLRAMVCAILIALKRDVHSPKLQVMLVEVPRIVRHLLGANSAMFGCVVIGIALLYFIINNQFIPFFPKCRITIGSLSPHGPVVSGLSVKKSTFEARAIRLRKRQPKTTIFRPKTQLSKAISQLVSFFRFYKFPVLLI